MARVRRYEHAVKYNGVWYAAGADIPVDEKAEKVDKKPVEVKPVEEKIVDEKPEIKTAEKVDEKPEAKKAETKPVQGKKNK